MPETPDSGTDRPLTRRELRERALAEDARRTLPSAAAHDVADATTVGTMPTGADSGQRTTADGPAQPVLQWAPRASLDDLFSPDETAAQHGGRKNKARGKGARRFSWLVILLFVVALVGAVVFAGYMAVKTYGDDVSAFFGWDGPHDYEDGEATGEATVTISNGDDGSAVSQSLYDAGVTLEPTSFYNYLISSAQNPTFYAGVYTLQQKMSSEAALAALEDPASKIDNTVTIIEGSFADDALTDIAEVTGIALEELQAQAADYTKFGVPADAPSIEGFFFPATYTFAPDATAEDVIRTLVDEMFSRLDALGVAEDDRLTVLTMAGLVQREAGSTEDMPKIARVFQNRIDQGMLLQSDATVAYGSDSTHTVWTTEEQRTDASNPYNTYVHEGLPPGPIGLPGEDAIKAALSPADGDWLYFVPINLETGETVFSETLAEQEAATKKLQEWCQASDENAVYCE